jgi:hypothetical protein
MNWIESIQFIVIDSKSRDWGAQASSCNLLERLSTGWARPVDKKSLQIPKLEHILVARIAWIRAEYALERLSTGWARPVDKKSLQIPKLAHIPVARIEQIRAEYALSAIAPENSCPLFRFPLSRAARTNDHCRAYIFSAGKGTGRVSAQRSRGEVPPIRSMRRKVTLCYLACKKVASSRKASWLGLERGDCRMAS